MTRTLSLTVRNLVFTIVVPGLGGVWVPWSILTRHGRTPTPAAWEAVPVIAAGVALYLCASGSLRPSEVVLPGRGTHRRALSRPGPTAGCATRSTLARSWLS